MPKKKIIYIFVIIFFTIVFGVIISTAVSIPDLTPRDKPENNNSVSVVSGQIQINLTIEGEGYNVVVPLGSTIYDAMVILDRAGDLNFKSSHYIGLGYFVQEINGRKNTGGNYWILYINGVYSAVGASQYILKEGDKIEWKYEN